MAQRIVTIEQYNFNVAVTDVESGALCFAVASGWFDMEDGTTEDMGDELNPIVNQLSPLIVANLWEQIHEDRSPL